MFRRTLRIVPLAVLAALIAGCGGAGGEGEGVVVAQVTVKPNGDVVTDSDGGVEIMAAPGTVAEDTLVTVEIFTAAAALAELGTTLDLDPAANALRFSADHELLLPLTVRVLTEQDALPTGIDFAVYVPVVLTSGGVPGVAGSPRTEASDATGDVFLQFRVDPGHIVVGGQEGGFYVIAPSDLFVTAEASVPGQAVPPEVAAGDVVHAKITCTCVGGDGLVPSGTAMVALGAPGFQAPQDAGGLVQFDPPLQAEGWGCLAEFEAEATCVAVPAEDGITWSMVRKATVPNDNMWNTKGGTPILSAEDHEIFASSEILAKKDDATGVGPLIKADHIAVSPTGLFHLARANETALYVGCSPDLAFVYGDAETIEGTVVTNLNPNPTIGGIPLTTRENFWFSKASLAAAVPVVDAMLFYGNSGYSIRHWVPEIDDFGATEVDPNSGSVSDADTYEEDKSRAVVVQSGRNQVRFVEFVTDPFPPFNARFTMRDVFAKGVRSTQFPGATGFVVSAARRTDASPVYFVTVGATPDDPGKLWRMDTPTDISSQATLVGDVGSAPRRIRFMKSIGIVSNSFSDTLTILVRDATDNVTIKGTVDVGDGPIGIGLIELPDGNIGVASAGFLDNTYTVTILEPDGDVVSNVTRPVPNGGDKPGCAVFANALGTKVAVSCSGSDEVIFIAIG